MPIREATTGDLASIRSLLTASELRTEGVLEADTCYWVAEVGDELVGAIGLELGDTSVLLRSAIVAPSARSAGIGRALTDTALNWAWKHGYRAAYCFSTDAGSYWIARGFTECPVDEVLDNLPNAPQVRLFRRLGWLPTEVAYRASPPASVD